MVVMFTYENFESMHQRLTELTKEANDGLAPAQRLVTYGDHWVRFWDMRQRLVIFGHVHTPEEIRRDEELHGAPENEIDYMLGETERRHRDGFMYGLCRSRWYPEGEWGDTHRGNLWPVDKDTYDEALAVGCDIDHLGEHGRFALQEAWTGYLGHVKEGRAT